MGAISCRLTSRQRALSVEAEGERWRIGLLGLCVCCLPWLRVRLGGVWASGRRAGFEAEVELSDTRNRPYHKAKKDNDIVFFALPLLPRPLNCCW